MDSLKTGDVVALGGAEVGADSGGHGAALGGVGAEESAVGSVDEASLGSGPSVGEGSGGRNILGGGEDVESLSSSADLGRVSGTGGVALRRKKGGQRRISKMFAECDSQAEQKRTWVEGDVVAISAGDPQ
jgi:hypothetical protein